MTEEQGGTLPRTRAGWFQLYADHRLARGLTGALVLGALLSGLSLVGAGAFGDSVITNFLVNVVAVVGIGVFIGNSGIVSFGHVAFMGIAAYVSGLLTIAPALKETTLPDLPGWLAGVELPLPVALLVTVVFVAAVALLVGFPIARLPGYSAAIATLGLLVIVHVVIRGARDFTRGAQTFFGVPPVTSLTLALVAALGAVLAARLFRESVPGLQLRASREDELAARSMGVNVTRLRLLAWVISASIVATAGVLHGHFLGAFSPREFFFVQTFTLLAMLIVGGSQTVTGALGGTALLTIVGEFLRRLESGFQIGPLSVPPIFGLTAIASALAILIVMYRRPEGLFGRREIDEVLYERAVRRMT